MRDSNETNGLLRLATRRDRRSRSKVHRWGRKAIVASGVVALATTASVAYAMWSATASGSGASKAASLVVSGSGTAPTTGGNAVHPFSAPGGSSGTQGGDLTVTIMNNNGYTLYVDSIQQNGLVSAAGGSGTCPTDTGTFPASVTQGSFAYVGTYTAGPPPTYASYTLPTPIAVPTSGSPQTVTITNIVGMTNSSPTGCQGATLTIPVTVTLGTS